MRFQFVILVKLKPNLDVAVREAIRKTHPTVSKRKLPASHTGDTGTISVGPHVLFHLFSDLEIDSIVSWLESFENDIAAVELSQSMEKLACSFASRGRLNDYGLTTYTSNYVSGACLATASQHLMPMRQCI